MSAIAARARSAPRWTPRCRRRGAPTTSTTALLAPTFATAQTLDISSLRKRGTVTFDLGKQLPFDLSLTYMRERKTGYRGASGGDIVSAVASIVDVPEPLNELTQDFGFRSATTSRWATSTRPSTGTRTTTRPRRCRSTTRSSPSTWPTTTCSAEPARRPGHHPDHQRARQRGDDRVVRLPVQVQEADARRRRLRDGDVDAERRVLSLHHQLDDPDDRRPRPADVSSLQQPSLNGKINTTPLNFWFLSRPVQNLGIRARYRSYDLTNKTTAYVITGDTSDVARPELEHRDRRRRTRPTATRRRTCTTRRASGSTCRPATTSRPSRSRVRTSPTA